jgi:hypothetical protein
MSELGDRCEFANGTMCVRNQHARRTMKSDLPGTYTGVSEDIRAIVAVRWILVATLPKLLFGCG